MNDTLDEISEEWEKILQALRNSFFYDNLIPIERIEREFDCVLFDMQRWCSLRQTVREKPISARAQVKYDQLHPAKAAERIEKLINQLEQLSNFEQDEKHEVNQVIDKLRRSNRRLQWHKEQHSAATKAIEDAEALCRRLLEVIRTMCSNDDDMQE
jgi:hypothetical protein